MPLSRAARTTWIVLPAASLGTCRTARGDVASVQGHLSALADDAPALAAYVTLSRAALTLARERGTPLDRLAEISAALDAAVEETA